MNSLVEFKQVNKKYKTTEALNNLSFSIDEKESIALVGNNGCGKTTTVNVLSNIIPYNTGEVIAFGKKVSPSYVSYKSKLGILLSPPILIDEFTPFDYLKFVCKFQKVNANEISERIYELAEFLEIVHLKNKRICEYSSGDKMKIAISAAIIHNPEILVFDEPFIYLDPKTIDFTINLLKSLKESKTIFITSNNIDVVLEVCDKFFIMEKGYIIETFCKKDNIQSIPFKSKILSRLKEMNKDYSGLDWLK